MKRPAVVFLTVSILIILAADAIFALRGGEHATISWQIEPVLHEFPIVDFLAGLFAGHLFWRIND